jgi:hypothetical protein
MYPENKIRTLTQDEYKALLRQGWRFRAHSHVTLQDDPEDLYYVQQTKTRKTLVRVSSRRK